MGAMSKLPSSLSHSKAKNYVKKNKEAQSHNHMAAALEHTNAGEFLLSPGTSTKLCTGPFFLPGGALVNVRNLG